MTSSTHYSEDFLNLLDIWPKCYLGFPAAEVRGQALSKAYIILENITQQLVIFRIVQEQSCSLNLKCKPGIGFLLPGCIQRIEILNTSEHTCTLVDRIYVEAIAYKSNKIGPNVDRNSIDEQQFTVDQINEYIEGKTMEYFCLKCYETNTIALIPMEEQLFRIEQRLKSIELIFKTFSFWFIARNWSVPFMLMLFIFVLTLIVSWINYSTRIPSTTTIDQDVN